MKRAFVFSVFQNESWPPCLEPLKMPLELETGVLQGNLAALALIDVGQVNEAMPQVRLKKRLPQRVNYDFISRFK